MFSWSHITSSDGMANEYLMHSFEINYSISTMKMMGLQWRLSIFNITTNSDWARAYRYSPKKESACQATSITMMTMMMMIKAARRTDQIAWRHITCTEMLSMGTIPRAGFVYFMLFFFCTLLSTLNWVPCHLRWHRTSSLSVDDYALQDYVWQVLCDEKPVLGWMNRWNVSSIDYVSMYFPR